MKTPTAFPQSADWRLFRGDRKRKTAWDMPPPPPWRPYRTPEAQARAGLPQAPLSATARINARNYQSTPEIVRMVNAALHLRRPLLVTGAPGSGKSTLADAIAYELDLGEPLRWPVTSRSTLREGLYDYDAIGRMKYKDEKAKADSELDIGDFIELGPLGTSMLPSKRPRVLLIDEIDKADIDLPNDLLNILDQGHFHLRELSRISTPVVKVRRFQGTAQVEIVNGQVDCYEFPLVILTSNDERDFPAPFLRRCLRLRMPDPCADRKRLDAIVSAHLGKARAGASSELIASFMQRAKAGEVLATDQLLNAIQMVMGAYAMHEDDRSSLATSLTAALNRRLA